MQELVLHVLEDSLEGGPTWCVHELHAERGVVGRGEDAEELLFVLSSCQHLTHTP